MKAGLVTEIQKQGEPCAELTSLFPHVFSKSEPLEIRETKLSVLSYCESVKKHLFFMILNLLHQSFSVNLLSTMLTLKPLT